MQKTKSRKWLWVGVGAVALVIIAAIAGGDKEKNKVSSSNASSSADNSSVRFTSVGQTLQTDYFSVQVNSVSVKNKVATGNEFADLPAEDGNKYLIIDVTLKNTDTESRMMFDGEVRIEMNGKEYKYESPEPIMADGWGMIMDDFNPGVKKRTKIVFKLPSTATGKAYYIPGRSDDDERIDLGII